MITQAEALIRDGVLEKNQPGLGFDVGPVERSETMFIQPRSNTEWWQQTFRLPFGHVQALGSLTWTLLDDNATVTYSGDTGTITVSGVPTGVLPEEVRVYIRTADGAGLAADGTYRIADVRVVVSGTTVTVTGNQALFVKPSVLEGVNQAEYTTSANFVTGVDVYRVTVNAQLPVTIGWDNYAATLSGDPSTDATQTGTARIVDSASGSIQPRPATYANGAHVFAYPTYEVAPDKLTVAYVGGHEWGDPAYQRIAAPLETAVLRLANVLSRDLVHWLNDPAQTKWRGDRALPSDSNPLQPGEETCPYGLTNGARFAWMIVQQNRLFRVPF
jgi:hypothetical protein